MHTDELERQLRDALRQTLDRELGLDPTWTESPAARRVAGLDRRRGRWPLRALAVAALIGAGGGAALLGGRLNPAPEVSLEATNGWIAFTVEQEDPAGVDPDTDIWFVALDQEPRRVIGTDTDGVDQLCPAFAPDGRSLAYGSFDGEGPVNRDSAVVIADVADDGTVADRLTIDVGDGLPPPCPVWSPDGRQIAFGVPRTSPVNPETSAAGSEVWLVTVEDGRITVLADLLATDLEWSSNGDLLAIASGADERTPGNRLHDGRIHLYEPSSGVMRSLEGTLGAIFLTWSPDGRRIAYATIANTTGDSDDSDTELRVVDIETGEQEVLTAKYHAFHGIGPVWSPDGETIAYQRESRQRRHELHEVVLVTPDDRSEQNGLASEVVLPIERTTADGSRLELFPWHVTWSPDATYLLYVAWTFPIGCCDEGTVERTVVAAVPTDADAPAVLLAGIDGIGPYDGDTTFVPIQIWQGRAADAVAPTLTTEPSASAQVSPSPSAVASPTLAPNDTSAWLPFVSERYGFSIAYPPDWEAHPANGDWTFPDDTAWRAGVEATDWFDLDGVDGSVAASAWSVALEPGASADQWFLDYCAVEVTPCDGTEAKVAASLDGHAGWFVPSSDPQAYFGIGDRIYLVVISQPEDHPALERYGGGRQLVEAFLSTMRLLPDQQSPAPSSP